MSATQIEPTMQPINAPYEIPEDWKWEIQSDVCSLKDGEKVENKNFPYLEVKYLRGNKDAEFINKGKFIKKGSKVILVDGENSGEVFSVNEDGYMGSTFKQLIINDKVDEKYFQFFIDSKKLVYRNSKKGSAIPHLNKTLFFNMPIPLPPLETQKAIVTKIETLFADLDSARDKVQHVLETSGERKAAILHQAFTGKLTAKWREENGVTLDDWQEKTLGDVAITVKDKYNPNTDEKINLPYIGLEHIEKNNGLCGQGNIEEVKSLKTLFKNGDILYGKLRPYLDKHDIADFDGVCSTDILVYRTNESNTTKYINYLFGTSTFIQYAVENSNGINLPRTSEKAISSFSISLPPLAEQTEIVDLLDSLLGAEKTIAQNCQSVLDKIQDIKKAVLAKAFRGLL